MLDRNATRLPRPPRRRVGPPAVDALEGRRLFAFGLTTTTAAYTVDTGGGLVFSVLRGGTISSTIHLGDLTSAKYNGTETLATYAQTSRYSHYEQGLTSTAVISATVDPAGQWIKITCDDSAAATGGVIQYYVARKGDANLYMASLPTDVNNGPGEGRFIAYMSRPVFPNIEDSSDTSTTNGTVEGSDVFYNTTTGITKSKFYSPRRMIDNAVHGVTGTGIGAFMNTGSHERSSGGPFFKDIDFQTTSSTSTEMYDALFTGHEQTEAFRQGLQGPYAMQYTNGAAPAAPNYAFLEGVGISGLVPASGRGAVAGTASGVAAGHTVTVTLSNADAQYWDYADAGGAYAMTGVLPGTYTQTIYDGELAVGTQSVTVTAGATTPANIVDTYFLPTPTWRIGTWDGTPVGFLNADRIGIMHPSDVRMSPWTVANDNTATANNFVVGTNADADFPLAEFKDVNNSTRLTFTLTAAQAQQQQTLRIGITDAFAGGRPNVTVNAGTGTAWTSAFQNPSTQPDSRSITRGTWRGNNATFTFTIPTGKLVAGVNTVDLPVISGSTGSTVWLSPTVVFDAIDLVPTATLTNAPVVKTIVVTPASPTVTVGGTRTFTATAYDQFGQVTPANVAWTAATGTVNGVGVYTAPATAGTDTVTATVGAVAGSTTVTVGQVVPTTFGAAYGDGFYVRLAADGVTEQIWTGTPGAVGPAFSAAPTYATPLSQLTTLTFGPGSAANGALTVDASNGNPIPTGGIVYDGGGGTDTLAVVGSGSADTVFLSGARVTVNSRSVSVSNVEVARLTMGAGADTVTQQGQPTAAVTWADPSDVDTLNVIGGTFTFGAAAAGAGVVTVPLKTLSVGSGATLAMASATARPDRTVLAVSATPSIAGSAGAWSGSLDLGANDLLVRSAVTATVLNQVATAAAGGTWSGLGIRSTAAAADAAHLTALGAVVNDGTTATFDGLATAAGDVLVRFTYVGDTNLDGVVNAADYTRADVGLVTGRTGWANGDVNYDAAVDGSDYALMDNAFNRQPVAMGAAITAAPAAKVAAAAAAPGEDDRKRRHGGRPTGSAAGRISV